MLITLAQVATVEKEEEHINEETIYFLLTG